ncbi:MAG: Ig-like domain-containing protein [Candidatus Buchananbacteria bacterium]|nr:Ig-like domain-containing protein [Candidatus Buchananbacteria bacterium]
MQKSKIAKRVLLVSFLAFFLLLILPSVGLAQAPNRFGLADAAAIGLPQNDLRVAIVRIIQLILGFLGIFAVIMVLYGGFVWMTSGGDPAKIEKAKKILINTVIGIIIILSSYIITAFIIGILAGFGGGGDYGHGGGGPGDLGRWGIGVGPIESVYPSPGQVDVPINTAIAVTFKEKINPQTICGAAVCNGTDTAMTNIEICQVDNNGICQEEGEEFSVGAFSGSIVDSNDDRTFTIIPNKYLGLEDFANRRFKVNLKSGIETVAEPGKSVFDNLFNEEYAWQFTTNGELDLDPPEIINLAGVYPYPDDLLDDYGVASGPTATQFSVALTLANIRLETLSSFDSTAVKGGGTTISGIITGNYGGTATGLVTVRVDSGTGEIKTTWPGTMGTFNSGQFDPPGAILNIGPYGLVFNADGVVARGNSWTFNVVAHQDGDKLELKDNSTTIKTYTFGTDIPNPAGFDDKLISDTNLFETCGANCVQTKQTGAATAKYNLNFIGTSSNFVITKTNGQDQQPNREPNGLPDAYRNTIIQINFNEAVNPSVIEDSIIVKRAGVAITGYTVEISNQYKTIELVAPDECGTNSCGDTMFCWPVSGNAQPYEVEISSATLMNASDAKCSAWGGISDGHGRCLKTVDGKQVFYPLSPQMNGLVDMSFNAFNGSFDTYQYNNKTIGIAQGQSGSGEGKSGRSKYDLNLGIICQPGDCSAPGSRVVSYGSSTPAFGLSGFGDNFSWSFNISSEIDKKAPLLKTDEPVGDDQINSPKTKVDFSFDRLMRSSTLKPGWNYGSTPKEKSVRYLVLQTISESAVPVGYWSLKNDLDQNFDGWADFTKASLNHNDFDLATKYGPLAGSGLQSISQNCFLPSAGPKEAAKSGQICSYNGYALSAGCAPVLPTNPASYGYLNCPEIENANECDSTDNFCKVLYYDESATTTDLGGSWIITKDHSTVLGDGSTGCCFGTCVPKP